MFIYWQDNIAAFPSPSSYFWPGQPFVNMPITANEAGLSPGPTPMGSRIALGLSIAI